MPFPLAHPAAVLPLRRYARWLNFPALVIGSLVPDAGYVFRNDSIAGISHQILGSLALGIPAGFLMLAAFYALRMPAVEMLPEPRRRQFFQCCDRPVGPLWLAAASLIIGIWTHVLWDSFTHNDGWIVLHLSILQTPVFVFAGRTARLCHILWYASTIVGVGWIYITYEKWRWSHEPEPRPNPGLSLLRYALPLSIFVILVSLVRHLIRGETGFILTAVLCSLLVILLAVRMTRTRRSIRY